ncbi:hypothetical protein ONZ51_g6951 [Trametes cubensis]|uniref:Uncharacterized protein n=1 Tax=Trametes cubensis TaxID=1111947 RepID=A0AAD7TR29_9APHY|nr:hypothetical protein ONZ51_g6951 [Trametes cubensis]
MVPVERVRAILEASRAGGSASTSANGSREYMPLSPRSEQAPGGGESAAEAQQANGGANGAAANAKPGRRAQRREPISVEDAVRMAVDQDVEQLIHLQEREELEEVYGMPVIYIPVFVPCLQRIDSFLFSLGYTLILAWAYLRSPLSFPPEYEPPGPPGMYSSRALVLAFPLVVLVHVCLSVLHSPPVLPRIGVHTTAYVGLLVGLGGFFTGLVSPRSVKTTTLATTAPQTPLVLDHHHHLSLHLRCAALSFRRPPLLLNEPPAYRLVTSDACARIAIYALLRGVAYAAIRPDMAWVQSSDASTAALSEPLSSTTSTTTSLRLPVYIPSRELPVFRDAALGPAYPRRESSRALSQVLQTITPHPPLGTQALAAAHTHRLLLVLAIGIAR